MNPDKLLDAIGMLDDRYFEAEPKATVILWRRKAIIFVAAILAIVITAGTAMALSYEFRDLIFSVFHIRTHEQPIAGNADTMPTEGAITAQSALQKIDIVDIDGIVNAHYFATEGIVLPRGDGLYTCSRDVDAVPEDAAFWEIRTDGIVEIAAKRIDFSLTYGGRTFRIVFDYAILNGKLSVQAWPQGLDEDPYANGWYVEAIGDRTDYVLLTVPVDIGLDFSADLLLLDLETLEVTDLLGSIPHNHVTIYGWRITEDLHYAILYGFDEETDLYGYWFCDLNLNTITMLDVLTGPTEKLGVEPYFLDDSTVIMQEDLGDGYFNIVRWYLPTGVQTVVIENVSSGANNGTGYRGIYAHGAHGIHGLLLLGDGNVDLIDLRTGATLNMSGLDMDKLTTSESPDSTRVLIAYGETNENGELGYGYSALGILNPETGILQMLTRDISGDPESFLGWLDNDKVVLLATNGEGGHYIYVYEFRELSM